MDLNLRKRYTWTLSTQALHVYSVGMKRSRKSARQYTIRGIPERTDQLLREKAVEYGLSLNETAVKVLQAGLGQCDKPVHHDFDVYAGTWVQDDVFDEVMKEFERMDEGMWS